jgi:hypothetical protein
VLPEWFVIVGISINVIASSDYLIGTLKGKTQPNRVTWFIWAAAPLIAFAAQLDEGVGLESLTVLFAGLVPLAILAASFVNPQATWKLTRFDLVCGFMAVAALVGWYLTQNANVAIALAIGADVFAAIPTIIKSYTHPKSERPAAYIGACIGTLITLATIDEWTFASYAFPLWIVLVTALIAGLIMRPTSRSGEDIEPATV